MFRKDTFKNENEFVDYVNLFFITALAALLYTMHGISFLLYARHPFLLITQALSICVCIAGFFVNRARRIRAASIIMILLVCTSVNIWSFAVDGGSNMRWYALMGLCPLYFFSILDKRDKFIFTLLIIASFLSATLISSFHEPLITMVNAKIYNTATSMVIIISVALEFTLYQYINEKKDSELTRIGTILDNIECGII